MFFVDELRRFFTENKIPAFEMSLKWIKEEPPVKKRNITHNESLVLQAVYTYTSLLWPFISYYR